MGYSIEQGKKNGEFRKDLDIKMAVDMLCGPIFFRLLSHPHDFDTDFAAHYPQEALLMIKS